MICSWRRILAAACLAWGGAGGWRSALGVDLSAGPMVGHVTETSARVWMQFPIAGEVTIRAYDTEAGGSPPVTQIELGLEGPTPFVCDVPLNNLRPSHSYRLDVKFEGKPVKLPPMVVRTCPLPGLDATFSVAFGSGMALSPMAPVVQAQQNQGPDAPIIAGPPGPTRRAMPIFKAILNTKPRAFMFLGNSGYLPETLEQFPDTHRAAIRFISDFHSAVRREPDLTDLLCSTACYGLYDDRDFGPVGADSHFVFGPDSLVAFERFWPNADWGTPESPGCFSTFHFGDVDFYLLDARTFRDPGDGQKGGTMLGAGQLAWLEKHIQQSTAVFKVLAAPVALVGDDPGTPSAEGWARFPEEQRGFLNFLQENGIGGVIALAGNQPAAQLTRLTEIPGSGTKLPYPIFTLGCSTLAGPINAGNVEAPPNALRVSQPVAGDTFGTLDFGGDHDHRFVTMRIHDDTGKTRVEQVLFAGQLQAGGSH